ncbi:MAG: hypothetical protein QMD08_04035 [Actinomycetota bacterium]|nr:hypothetical protein [Actinomycetota bacterium]
MRLPLIVARPDRVKVLPVKKVGNAKPVPLNVSLAMITVAVRPVKGISASPTRAVPLEIIRASAIRRKSSRAIPPKRSIVEQLQVVAPAVAAVRDPAARLRVVRRLPVEHLPVSCLLPRQVQQRHRPPPLIPAGGQSYPLRSLLIRVCYPTPV